ncbi:hypothetical protein LOZ53_003415 [Ophidiomyces ophidiicola]|nr:hypothetical protein LOZ55_003154 [Ophidiomyces ophidiicola]KAI1981794.1 hypothetical protein LOZ54_005509 [Ophidiomyces ophidiicola]KAI1987084.1 hypothetical protein LOZ51_005857 [Ophidiomyces ophidiicola]KAI1989947.1 hypothetical protein LOZ53_003415 [Ophidiomyces ophidiicola]KAI2052041.1 hypothetical protein LOZ43_004636 [Ophidiomyces ophidiicola]
MVSFGFSRVSKPPASPSSLPPSSANASTVSLTPTSSATTTASSSSSPPPTATSSSVTASTSLTLIEALRNNPFGTSSKAKCPIAILNDEVEKEHERAELNTSLAILAELFPDVKLEVFRELLVRFDGNSRLQVCVEQLLRYRNEWVKGRWNVPVGTDAVTIVPTRRRQGSNTEDEVATWAAELPEDERFRSENYKKAVKAALCHEFRSISRSAIEAVLAEANFSYFRARPTLRRLSRKTWRVALGNILSFKKTKEKEEPPLLAWQRQPNGDTVPYLKETGCPELDKELHEAFLEPLLTQIKEKQEVGDYKLAQELNEAHAKEADAVYECSCCLSDATFEEISMCSSSLHVICFTCIQRTIQEALFGQGWGNSIDNSRATLRCLAPLQAGTCDGTLDTTLVKRAVLADKAGDEAYQQFENRLVEESLLKSQLKLVRCPFCSYAEYDPVYHPPSKGLAWRFRRASLLSIGCMILVLLDMIPFLFVFFVAFIILRPAAIPLVFITSVRNLCLKTRNQRFSCSNTSCNRQSCITCQKPWRDPHVCHEPLLLNLRTTVEAARTAAIKRTCPRCGLSFVKSSGCNKLTCVCGYSMCYLCRKALGPPLTRIRVNGRRLFRDVDNQFGAVFDGPADIDNGSGDESADDEQEGEGYRHFCEHFRTNPGSRCAECNKCDLYLAEDEELVAQRAGEKAEREWKYRQNLDPISHRHLNSINSRLDGYGADKLHLHASRHTASWNWNWQLDSRDWRAQCRFWVQDVWRDGRWKGEAQYLVDRLVEMLIVVEA